MDLSLDDIIKRKNPKKAARGRSGFQRRPFRRNETSNIRIKSNNLDTGQFRSSGFTRGRGSQKIADARLKIIQKNRQKMVDARDKLAQIAKQTDARFKLNKLKSSKIIQTKQVQMKRGNRVETKLHGSGSLLQRTISSSINSNSDITDVDMEEAMESHSLLRRTVNNPRIRDGGDFFSTSHLYPPVDPTCIKVVAHSEPVPLVQQRQRPSLLHDNDQGYYYEEQHLHNIDRIRNADETMRLGSGRISQELKARLDTPTAPLPRTMGILSSTDAAPPLSIQGHRIVVSNLQPSVTHEDIKELFEDIGPLVTSHVVRPGTAEVIYKYQKDAKRAVDAYHNRQLDGQPMKCMLVNPRPLPTVGGPLRTNNAAVKIPSSSKSAVVPDITAIRKALFSK